MAEHSTAGVLQEVQQNKRARTATTAAAAAFATQQVKGAARRVNPSDADEPAAPRARAARPPKAPPGATRTAEQQLWAGGYRAVAGVDEAGRGPLAGPVVAAAVILPRDFPTDGIDDSKAISQEQREALYERITSHPDVAWAVAEVGHEEIDRVNILQAALLAMRRAVDGVAAGAHGSPDFCLVDGNRLPAGLGAGAGQLPARAVVKGDATCTCIAAASILAKVHRDRLMQQLHDSFPLYGFAQHKGYGVPAHMDALSRHGPCPAHRRSFEPVKSMVGWSRAAALAAVQEQLDEAQAAAG